MNFRDKIARFMAGRYGTDNLYNFFTIVELILIVINMFFPSIFLMLLIIGVISYSLFRVFSRNVSARREENAKYLRIKWKITSFFKRKKAPKNDKKTHVFRICPACKAKIRLPRKKGPHSVRCPRCNTLFEVHIR